MESIVKRGFKALRLPLILFGLLTAQSCATLLTKSHDTITVNSEPSGATVAVNGEVRCTTPCVTDVKRKMDAPTITVTLEGCSSHVFEVDQKLNGVALLNLVDPLGWLIDVATGKVKKAETLEYSVTLCR